MSTHSLQRLLKASENPVFLLDNTEKLVFANRLFCEYLNLSPPQLLGRPLRELYSPAQVKSIRDSANSSLVAGEILVLTAANNASVAFVVLENIIIEEENLHYIVLSRVNAGEIPYAAKNELFPEIKVIQENLFGLSGIPLFLNLAKQLSEHISSEYIYIGKLDEDLGQIYVLGGYEKGISVSEFSYTLENTPCANVISANSCLINSGVQQMFPKDNLLTEMGAVAYIGVPLIGSGGLPIGLMNAINTSPFETPESVLTVLESFAQRISLEVERFILSEELQKNERRYYSLFEKTEDAVFLVDAQDNILDANRAAENLTGYTITELCNKKHSEIYHLKDPRIDYGTADFTAEAEYTHTDGSLHQVFLRPVSLDDNNKFFIATDITRFNEIASKLTESEDRYLSILHGSPNPVIIHNEGRVLFINKQVTSLFGYEPEEVLGKSIFDFLFVEDREFVASKMQARLGAGKQDAYELKILTKQKKQLSLLINAHVISFNRQRAIISILTDITQLREQQYFQDILLRLSEIILYATDSGGLYLSIHNLLKSILIVDNFFIALVNRRRNELEFVYWSDEQDPNPGIVPLGMGLTEYVYKSNKPLNANKETTQLLENSGEIEVIGSDSFEWIGVPLRNEKGEPYGVLVAQNYTDEKLLGERQLTLLEFVSRQISLIIQKKNAEDALKKNEDQFKRIFSKSTIGMYRSTIDGKILLANTALAEMLEYTSEDELLSSSMQVTTFFDSFTRQKFISEMISRSTVSGKEYKWKTRSGRDLYVRESAQVIKDDDNNILYFEGLVENITDKKHAESKLREQQEQYFAFFHNSEQAALVLRDVSLSKAEFTLEMVNRYALSMLGLEHPLRPTLLISEVFDQKTLNLILKGVSEIKENGKTYSFEFSSVFSARTYLASLFRISRIHFALTAIDITNERLTQSKLLEAKDKAEEINRAKSSFFANMSHELRTPLMGIMGNAEIIFEGSSDLVARDYSERILLSTKRLYATVNSILTISELESGKKLTSFAYQLLNPIIETVYNKYKLLAEKKGLSLSLYSSNPDLMVETDSKLLQDITEHLLSNAVKFTHSGGISLSVEELEKEYTITIKDSGIGIDPDKLSMVFEPFRQESEGHSRKFEGTGLGLTIARDATALLNGTIIAQSKKSFGSDFILTFPKLQARIENIEPEIEIFSQPKQEIPTLERKNILLVENDDLNISVISAFLKNSFNIMLATNGHEALAFLRKYQFQAILLDINLGSGLSGLDVLSIAGKEKILPSVPIIASTAFAMSGDKEEFLKAGCTHYISKPFSRNELLKLMKEVLE